MSTNLPCRLLAARHFPGNEEAVLVGFPSGISLDEDYFPEGKGFLVSKTDLGLFDNDYSWIALLRQQTGSFEMFTMMACDIIGTLEASALVDVSEVLARFLARIRAWQEFMKHNSCGVLSPNTEIGLYGELIILASLLDYGLPAKNILDAWRGPRNEIHDFKIGTGAIEVKTTIAKNGFPATISSLEQLDDSYANPLCLIGVRLQPDPQGLTLGEQVDALERRMAMEHEQNSLTFGLLLMQSGYHSSMAHRYTRKFSAIERRLFQICEDVPRLVRGNVPKGIQSAQYLIDLDQIEVATMSLEETLALLRGTVL